VRAFLAAVAVGLALVPAAAGELVAKGVPDGLLAVSPRGVPMVAYARGRTLFVSRRVSTGHWRAQRAARLPAGSTLAAFDSGAAGPAVVVLGPRARSLFVVHTSGRRWQVTPVVRGLPAGIVLGWPGLALDRRGRAVVAYTRWRPHRHYSQLVLARLEPHGLTAQNVTTNGWPASYVAPPAAPVVMADGLIHVVETYGFLGTVGTIEWLPKRRSWTGQYLSGDQGDFPVGRMFAQVARSGVVYAAWTEATVAWDEFPVNLASHGHEIASDFVFDRGLTSGLALTALGPHVAANQWVSAAQLGLPGDGFVWAGTISGPGGTELDGWISGLIGAPRGAEDVLLGGTSLSWFRAASLPVRVSLGATRQQDGSIALAGRVRGRTAGSVTIYRERPGGRTAIGSVSLTDGAFSLVDQAPQQPALYRAVYVDPASGIPYARLLRQPVG
jgi:hypothetical protein